jgi:hypothetical protein
MARSQWNSQWFVLAPSFLTIGWIKHFMARSAPFPIGLFRNGLTASLTKSVMNLIGIAAVVLSVVGFAIAHKLLRHRSFPVRIRFLFVFALLAVPSILFAVYYLHILPEFEWFYALRSWPGSEFLVVFIG